MTSGVIVMMVSFFFQWHLASSFWSFIIQNDAWRHRHHHKSVSNLVVYLCINWWLKMSTFTRNSVSVSKIDCKSAHLSDKLQLFLKVRIRNEYDAYRHCIFINALWVVILMFDDAKPSRHYDALGHHQFIIFIQVISDAPWLTAVGETIFTSNVSNSPTGLFWPWIQLLKILRSHFICQTIKNGKNEPSLF